MLIWSYSNFVLVLLYDQNHLFAKFLFPLNVPEQILQSILLILCILNRLKDYSLLIRCSL
jgi:hypothetical protein